MTRAFERLVLAVILVNVAAVGWALLDEHHDAAIEMTHNGISAFFVLEMAIRLRMAGRAFFASKLNCFDLTVTLLSALPILAGGFAALRLVRFARIVHLARHSAHLRLFDLPVRRHNRAHPREGVTA